MTSEGFFRLTCTMGIKKVILPYILTLTTCMVSAIGFSQAYFDYNADIQEVYEQIIDLRFDEARASLDSLELATPDNLARLHIENYIDFFTIFIDEDEELFKELKKDQKRRLKQIDSADDSSPYKLFAQAEINLQWAIMRSKFGEQIPVLKDIYSAYRDLKENQAKFPEFEENKKSLSIIHAVNETIPIPKFIKRLFALEGSIERGEKEIQEMLEYSIETNSMFYPEALGAYAVITLYQRNDLEKAYEIIQSSQLNPAKSPLVGFLFAKIAQRAGYNDAAIQYLTSCPKGEKYKSFDYLDFLLGLSYLRQLNPKAKSHLEAFVQNFEGRLYIKEAYQKLAWNALVMEDNIADYKKYIALAGSEGTSIVDDDKQAEAEAKNGEIPNPEMLKSRLLFDGGYYKRAYNTLIKNAHRFVYNKKLILEYNYRMGRCSQALKNYPDAVVFFSQTIDKGMKSKEYYACNAALQMGTIFEIQNDYKKAKKYFKMCRDMKPSKYKTSLHQKAKAGLERIKN